MNDFKLDIEHACFAAPQENDNLELARANESLIGKILYIVIVHVSIKCIVRVYDHKFSQREKQNRNIELNIHMRHADKTLKGNFLH